MNFVLKSVWILVDRSLRFFSSTKSNNLNKQMAPQLFVVEFRDFSGAVDMFWELLDPLVFCTIFYFYADTAPAFQKLQKAQRAWDLRTSAHQDRIKLSKNCEQMSPICETVKLLLLSNFHFQTSWQCFPQNQLKNQQYRQQLSTYPSARVQSLHCLAFSLTYSITHVVETRTVRRKR